MWESILRYFGLAQKLDASISRNCVGLTTLDIEVIPTRGSSTFRCAHMMKLVPSFGLVRRSSTREFHHVSFLSLRKQSCLIGSSCWQRHPINWLLKQCGTHQSACTREEPPYSAILSRLRRDVERAGAAARTRFVHVGRARIEQRRENRHVARLQVQGVHRVLATY